jgi:ABC-type glycerol-3-phosphate transport system substrate-binding protein
VLIAGKCIELVNDMYGDYYYDWTTKKMTAEGNESYKHAVQMFYDMFVTDKVTPSTMSTKDIGGGFETGKYPMALIHYWDIASLSSTVGDAFDWDIVQFPFNEQYGTRWKSPLYVQALSISSASQHKEAAFEFIKWWASNEKPQTAMADSFPVCSTCSRPMPS